MLHGGNVNKNVVPLLTPGAYTNTEVCFWLSITFHCSFSEFVPNATVVMIVLAIY